MIVLIKMALVLISMVYLLKRKATISTVMLVASAILFLFSTRDPGMLYTAILGTTREMVDEGLVDASATLKVLESGKEETVIVQTVSGKTVLSTGVPVYDRDGKIHRVYSNVRDITDLNNLRQKYQQTQTLKSKYLVELNELKKSNPVEFVAHSRQMRKVIDIAYRIANVDSTVLILGESGVGKDLIARMIHKASTRNDAGPFLKINCGAIPGELLESELFGYEAGAFTGASKEGKAGYFELADKGTLFLDEIGELPKNLQVKLLTAIQDQRITRVGGVKAKESKHGRKMLDDNKSNMTLCS